MKIIKTSCTKCNKHRKFVIPQIFYAFNKILVLILFIIYSECRDNSVRIIGEEILRYWKNLGLIE